MDKMTYVTIGGNQNPYSGHVENNIHIQLHSLEKTLDNTN